MIAVIIPVYNDRPTLARCVRSVKRQTTDDWRCIIVNDGSTDGTKEEMVRLAGDDTRFTLISSLQNSGLGPARNLGLQQTDADRILFLDADDYLDADALEYLDRTADANPAAGRIVTPKYLNIEDYGLQMSLPIIPTGFHEADSPYLFADNTCDIGYATGCLYIRHNIPCGIRFPKVAVHEDMLLNMELLFAGVSVLITDRLLYHYVRRGGTLIDTPLSQDDLDRIISIFEETADAAAPEQEKYERCRRFLDNALSHRNKKK